MAEVVNTVRYKVEPVDTGQMDLSLSSFFGRMRGELLNPMKEAMSFPRGEMSPGGRMTLSQDIQAGWANIKTAANEYRQEGFYRQTLFGAAPEFSGAGLRNKFFLQGQAATQPFLPATQNQTAEDLQRFAERAQAPFNGIYGFQQYAGTAMASAQQAGMANYAYTPRQLMQADQGLRANTFFAQAYNVPAQETGRIYAGVMTAGVQAPDASAAFQAALRMQASGVPIEASINAMQRATSMQAFRDTVGQAPGMGGAEAASIGVYGKIFEQQMALAGQPVRPGEGLQFANQVESIVSMTGFSDKNLNDALTSSLRMIGGQRAQGITAESLRDADRQLELNRTISEEDSGQLLGLRERMKRMFSPGENLRNLFGLLAGVAPEAIKTPALEFLGVTSHEMTSFGVSRTPFTAGALAGISRFGPEDIAGVTSLEVSGIRKSIGSRAAIIADPQGAFQKLSGYAGRKPETNQMLVDDYGAFLKSKEFGGTAAGKLQGTFAGKLTALGAGAIPGVAPALMGDVRNAFVEYETSGKGMLLNEDKRLSAMGVDPSQRAGYFARAADLFKGAGLTNRNDEQHFAGNAAMLGGVREFLTGAKKREDVEEDVRRAYGKDSADASTASTQLEQFFKEADAARTKDGAYNFAPGSMGGKLAKGATVDWETFQQEGAIAGMSGRNVAGMLRTEEGILKSEIDRGGPNSAQATRLMGEVKAMREKAEKNLVTGAEAAMTSNRVIQEAGGRKTSLGQRLLKVQEGGATPVDYGTGAVEIPLANAMVKAGEDLGAVSLLLRQFAGARQPGTSEGRS